MSTILPPIHVIGLGPSVDDAAELLAKPQVRDAQVLVGGKALLALLAAHPAEKLPVSADTASLLAALKRGREEGKRQCVLCSGDPLFFGLGARLAESLGPEAVAVHPAVSSLQAAAALLGRPWEGIRPVSLHGRASRLPLAHALMDCAPVFVLTDAANGPESLAAWMLERGHGDRVLHVIDELRQGPDGGVSAASHTRLTVNEALALPQAAADMRRVVLIDAPAARPQPLFGLRDDDIAHEKALITKQPVRAAALSALGFEADHVFWDLGSGSGAAAVEAALLLRRGQVTAVECKPERLAFIEENRRRFGAANLEIVQGRMPACLPPSAASGQPATGAVELMRDNGEAVTSPRPDRIFIGGGLGGDGAATRDIVHRAWEALKPGGRLLAACVLLHSLERARAALLDLGAHISVTCLHASQSSPLAGDMRLEALNPVFLVLAEKSA